MGRGNSETLKAINVEEREALLKAEEKLIVFSMSNWESALDDNVFRLMEVVPEVYVLFSCEPLQNLQLWILKVLEGCVGSYLSSETILTNYRDAEKRKSRFVRDKASTG